MIIKQFSDLETGDIFYASVLANKFMTKFMVIFNPNAGGDNAVALTGKQLKGRLRHFFVSDPIYQRPAQNKMKV